MDRPPAPEINTRIPTPLLCETVKLFEELGLDFIAKKKPVFSNDDNFTLSAFGRKFDYLMAQSIFSHTSPAQTQRCLQEAAKVMHRGSLFAATYIRGPESYTGTAWSDP